jgi:Skp family chaperone for outer membrane proteins
VDDVERVYAELQKQEGITYSLRKRITNLQAELRYERRKNGRLQKELKEKQKQEHYRNGQKRSNYGRN